MKKKRGEWIKSCSDDLFLRGANQITTLKTTYLMLPQVYNIQKSDGSSLEMPFQHESFDTTLSLFEYYRRMICASL